MTLPGQTFTFVDGNTNQLASPSSIPTVIGPSSAGVINSEYTFSQTTAVNSAIGFGPAQYFAENILRERGGTVKVVVASGSIAGWVSAVVSSSGGTFVISGTPNDTYDVKFNITKAGAPGTAMFTYRLDGQDSSATDSITVPGTLSYPLPNTGLTVTFGGTYSLGQTATFTTKGREMNSTDLNGAFAAMSTPTPMFIVIANDSLSAASGSALFTPCDTQSTTMNNKKKFTSIILPTGGTSTDTPSQFSGSFATPGNGIMVVAEKARLLVPSPFPGYANPRVPFAAPVAARCAAVDAPVNPGFRALGGLTGVSSPTYDEFQNGELYNLYNIVAPQTSQDDSSIYLNQAWLKSPIGSDYRFWMWKQVIDIAAAVTHQAQAQFINSSPRVLADGTGRIDPRDAVVIETHVNSQLRAALLNVTSVQEGKPYASDVKYSIDRTTNVLSTQKLTSQTQVVTLGLIANINTTVGFASALSA